MNEPDPLADLLAPSTDAAVPALRKQTLERTLTVIRQNRPAVGASAISLSAVPPMGPGSEGPALPAEGNQQASVSGFRGKLSLLLVFFPFHLFCLLFFQGGTSSVLRRVRPAPGGRQERGVRPTVQPVLESLESREVPSLALA